jgi:hypothetical protein
VVRAGYGIYHDSSWNQGAQGLWQNPPYYAESFEAGASMSTGFQVYSAPPSPANFEGTIISQDRNFKQGRIQQFNVNVEQELPGHVVVTTGYAGSRASHILEFGNNINVTSPSACGTVSGYTLGCGPNGSAIPIPYPAFAFSEIDSIFDVGRAHYNSLQIKAETKNARHGIYALVAYTYSRAYDNGFSDGLGSVIGATYFPLPNYQNLDWGLSQINLNQNFTASIIYTLPFGKGQKFGGNLSGVANALAGGWELTVIEHATSGFPIFVVDSNNTSGAGFLNTNAESDPSESDLQSGAEQPDSLRVVQPELLRAAGARPAWQCQPHAALRSGFCQYGLFSHQALRTPRGYARGFPHRVLQSVQSPAVRRSGSQRLRR